MARYIDAETLVERIKASSAFPNMREDGYFLLGCVCNLIESQPTVDVQDVRHGRWENSIFAHDFFRCSECCAVWNRKFKYCPNCGAKMDGKDSKA